MTRETLLFIIDIKQAIEDIESFTNGVDKNSFLNNKEKQYAVIRSLEIIGEAVKNVPDSVRKKYPAVEWKKIAGLRDVLIHSYFGADIERVWEVTVKDLPKLKQDIENIIKDEEKKRNGKEKKKV